jgi:hypothetical protein
MYSLVLANIMSPRIWPGATTPGSTASKMKPYRRITRLKQYIMDHYAFNLDLDTWGLTTKERELARFKDFIDRRRCASPTPSSATRATSTTSTSTSAPTSAWTSTKATSSPTGRPRPWRPWTPSATRPGYSTGAGECVSLATLYAAALFVVAGSR